MLRSELGLGPTGPNSPTLARLDVGGQDSVYEISGHGQDVSLRVNAISRTHAETDALQQIANRGGAQGADAMLYVDYPDRLCRPCGNFGAVASMKKQTGINRLNIVWPNGAEQK